MSEGQAGEVVQGIAPGRLGPVDHAGDLVTVDEHVGDLQVAVHEHRCPRPQRGLGNPAVARDQVGGLSRAAARLTGSVRPGSGNRGTRSPLGSAG